MGKNRIVAIVGMCGTGKSVVTKYIVETFKFESIYYGGFVLEEVKRRNLEINSVNEKNVREELRHKQGLDVMAKMSVDKINVYLSGCKDVIIDGLYSFSEYLFLKEKYGESLTIIALHSSRQTRYRRLSHRKVRPLTPEQVDKRDYNEIKNIEKAGPIAIADFHIINNNSFPKLRSHIDYIFEKLMQKTS
jgi:dephospho-CoA kinase